MDDEYIDGVKITKLPPAPDPEWRWEMIGAVDPEKRSGRGSYISREGQAGRDTLLAQELGGSFINDQHYMIRKKRRKQRN